MLLIIEGYNSSYSIWSKMKKDEGGKSENKKAMTYRNTSKRIVRLFDMGLLNEIKPHSYQYVPHGRKDYSISDKGMRFLITKTMLPKEEAPKIFQHIKKFGLDEHVIGEYIVRKLQSELGFCDKYLDLVVQS